MSEYLQIDVDVLHAMKERIATLKAESERLVEIERSAKGLMKVMKDYPLNNEYWWKWKEALEEALLPQEQR